MTLHTRPVPSPVGELRLVASDVGLRAVLWPGEDDDRVRRTAINLLQKQGYSVLEANKATDALRIVDTGSRIDLLFSDVMLPDGINGTQLAKQVLTRRPEIRVLLTSGYAQATADKSGRLAGHKLLTKPYRRGELASAIRAVLDQPAA